MAAAGRRGRRRCRHTGLAAAAPSYALVLLLVFIAGIGIAAYHPEGAKFAAYASGRKRASGMSYFNIGGNTGYALGPIVVTPLVIWLGLEGGLIAMLPVLGGCHPSCVLPALRRVAPEHSLRRASHGDDDVRAMSLLAIVIAFRSVAWFGLLASSRCGSSRTEERRARGTARSR